MIDMNTAAMPSPNEITLGFEFEVTHSGLTHLARWAASWTTWLRGDYRSIRTCGTPFLLFATLLAVRIPQAFAEEIPQATFFRGINLNGPAVTIDGNQWEAGDTPNLRCAGNAFDNQSVPLKPATDAERTRMIRSSRWGRPVDVDLLNIPPGEYQLCIYVWEDNSPTTFTILVNDRKVLERYPSGNAGAWKRLGPWRVRPVDGFIRITAKDGDANLSGVEIWSGSGELPLPLATSFNQQPTDEELAFFESKIRPVLVNNCYECHSVDSKEVGGNLLLDSRIGIVRGGDTEPPIIPGDPASSLFMRAIRHTDPDLKMPPGEKLASYEIADLERWIELRAPDTRTTDPGRLKLKSSIDWDKGRDFWSLKSLTVPVIPAVKNQTWPANEIDRFILARIESAGLSPVEDAGKGIWLRRVTYDLIGLPPSPEELAQFEQDQSSGAYERVVDRLLQSSHYGERWGRHWMDVIRYADTAGDNSDYPIPQMYRYRNWIIDAFNRDLPYDQFIREQLAGDLIGGLPNEARERLIATGYIANARRFGSRVDDYPQHLTIEDTLDNLGRTFLGMTINCARCHNHKFDPITTDDYYGLYGIFHSTRYPWPGIELEQKQRDLVPLIPVEEANRIREDVRREQAALDQRVRDLEKEKKSAEGDARKSLEKQIAKAREVARKHSQSPPPFEEAYAVAEAFQIEDVAIQQKGDPSKRGAIVPRHFLTILNGEQLNKDDPTSGRLQLASWIVDRNNPLTARVMVNRLWLYHFGKGLVATPNDFGRQGRKPTHPELLDHLATQFIASGWSIKAMHRQIVLSRTYRLSSRSSERNVEVDPTNELLASFPRNRLDAESIRDTLLLLSGRMDLSVGGAHPFPPQTEWKFTQHNPFKAIYDTNRRSVYLMTQRIQRHPYLAIFDGPDPSASTPARISSTTPLQALYLLNDAFVHESAAGLAKRLLEEAPTDETRVERAYLLILSRRPEREELDASQQFLSAARQKLQAGDIAADQLDSQTWQSLIRALFRLNEFVYID